MPSADTIFLFAIVKIRPRILLRSEVAKDIVHFVFAGVLEPPVKCCVFIKSKAIAGLYRRVIGLALALAGFVGAGLVLLGGLLGLLGLLLGAS